MQTEAEQADQDAEPDELDEQRLTNTALIAGHEMLLSISKSGMAPIGQPLLCAMRWPRQHKREVFVFASLPTGERIGLYGITRQAVRRYKDLGVFSPRWDTWSGLQDWHEQFAFMARLDVQPLKRVNPAGLVLPH